MKAWSARHALRSLTLSVVDLIVFESDVGAAGCVLLQQDEDECVYGAWLCGCAFVCVCFACEIVCVVGVVAILVSIVVSIPACHAGDPGSIPGREAFALCFLPFTLCLLLLVFCCLLFYCLLFCFGALCSCALFVLSFHSAFSTLHRCSCAVLVVPGSYT